MKRLYLLTLISASLFSSTIFYAQNWDPIGPIDANHPFPFKDGSVYFTTALDNNGLLYTAYPNFNDDDATIVIKTFNETTGIWEDAGITPYTEYSGRDYVIQFDSNNVMYIGYIGEVNGNYERALVLKRNGNTLELVGQADITGKKVSRLRFRISDDDTLLLATASMNFVWNNQSQNSGVLNMYSFDGSSWNQDGQEINVGYTNTYFIDLEVNSNNEAIVGYKVNTDPATYFKKLSANTWVDYRTTSALNNPSNFILTGTNEDIIVTSSNTGYQGEVWLDNGGFTKIGTVSTKNRSDLNEIKNDNNGDLILMGSDHENWDDRVGWIKKLDPNTNVWNTIGDEIPLVNGFGYTSLLFDAQNTPILGYYNSTIGISRKLNINDNSWDYLGTPGILELETFGLELDAGYDSDENLYVLQTEHDNGAYLNKFNTATDTWENEARFLEGIDVDEAKLIINQKEATKYVALRSRDPNTNDDIITVFKYEANNWSELGNNPVLELEEDEPDEIQFKIDAAGDPIVAYWDDDDSEYIKIRKLINGTWQTIGDFRFLDDDDEPLVIAEEYGFAINSQGVPFLVLMHDDYDKIKLFKYDTGTTWTEIDVTSLPDADEIFSLNIAEDDTIYISYEDNDTREPLVITYTETAQQFTTLSQDITQYEFWGDPQVSLGADDIPIAAFREDLNDGTRAKFKLKRYNATNDTWETLNTDALTNTYWDEYKVVISATNEIGFVFDHGFVYAKGFQAPFTPADEDEDGVRDSEDTCPNTPIGEAVDENGCSDSQKDTDEDGVNDALDNCPLFANAEQLDTDEDGEGDLCDTDDDNDGTQDSEDDFPLDENEDTDTDGDEIGNNADTDDDNDGTEDSEDDFPLDETEDTDTDGDGTGNNTDTDDDNDGTEDSEDDFPLDETEDTDTDGDGTGNNTDTDDDNDGFTDEEEATANTDPLDAADMPNDESTSSKTMVPAEAFTPNGDGINDAWVIPGIENFPNNVVRVFNRWGNEVFSVQSYQNNWEGFYRENNEKLPAGQYMYIIELGNNTRPIQGWIFLNY